MSSNFEFEKNLEASRGVNDLKLPTHVVHPTLLFQIRLRCPKK